MPEFVTLGRLAVGHCVQFLRGCMTRVGELLTVRCAFVFVLTLSPQNLRDKSERGCLLSVEMSLECRVDIESDFAICLVLTCCPMSARAVSVTRNGLVT